MVNLCKTGPKLLEQVQLAFLRFLFKKYTNTMQQISIRHLEVSRNNCLISFTFKILRSKSDCPKLVSKEACLYDSMVQTIQLGLRNNLLLAAPEVRTVSHNNS